MKVKGYENYEVKETGVVIGARGKVLKLDFNSTGYARVTLCKEGVTKRVFVHRLVAETFMPTDNRQFVVNHIDGDHQNNRLDNLEWVTMSYNVKDGWVRGRDSSHLHLNFRK